MLYSIYNMNAMPTLITRIT